MAGTTWLLAAAIGLVCLGISLWLSRRAGGAKPAPGGPTAGERKDGGPGPWSGPCPTGSDRKREELEQRVAWLEEWHVRRTLMTEEAMGVIRSLSDSALRCAELAGDHYELQALLDSMLDQLRRVERDLRRIRSPLESVPQWGTDLGQELKALAAAARHTSAMAVEVRIDESLTRHRPSRRQLVKVLQLVAEALTNALRHSQGSRVALRAGVVNRRVVVSISDDGQGFDPRTLHTGGSGGLSRMRALAEAMKGLLQVETARGAGTIITLSLPLESWQHQDGGPACTYPSAPGRD